MGALWVGGSLGPPRAGAEYPAVLSRCEPAAPEESVLEDGMELGAARASRKDVELERVACYEAHSEINQKCCQTKEEQSVSSSSQ